MNTISFKNISVYYQTKSSVITALDNLSLTLNKKINVILGKSGSGKTSLLNCLSGHVIYKGDVFIDEKSLKDISLRNRKMSYVNQDIVLYPNLTIYENIIFPLEAKKLNHEEADQKVKDIAHKLKIEYTLSRKPKHISLGQAQRASFARALVKESDIYLFDEPFANVDKENSEIMINLLKKEVFNKKKTVLFVTHNINHALAFGENIIVLDEGKLVGEFAPKEFLNSKNKIIKELLSELENEKD